jgi:hypothetical protein
MQSFIETTDQACSGVFLPSLPLPITLLPISFQNPQQGDKNLFKDII